MVGQAPRTSNRASAGHGAFTQGHPELDHQPLSKTWPPFLLFAEHGIPKREGLVKEEAVWRAWICPAAHPRANRPPEAPRASSPAMQDATLPCHNTNIGLPNPMVSQAAGRPTKNPQSSDQSGTLIEELNPRSSESDALVKEQPTNI
ncbi:hypothetical protein L7F22_053208 [Adiantum nelumboides]|nr:hypothetical protein [Adiantum nelumboides]